MKRPHLALSIYATLLVVSVGVYAAALYAVYTLMSTPHTTSEKSEVVDVKTSTVRIQEKIETLFLTQENVAELFTMLDVVAARHAVQLSVQSVSNAQASGKNKDALTSSIDVKVVLKGEWEQVQRCLHALETLPALSRLLDISISETKDAQAPTVETTIRFFLIKQV